jgi:tRNA 2-selenouridine synthase
MPKVLDISSFLTQSTGQLTIDVRSPGEYSKGHIPHAVNLPLFDNDERAKVGTCYKQQGRDPAVEMGLDIVGPKLGALVRYARTHAVSSRVYVHCWRGGMRSGSMAWLLETAGWEVYVLRGGYKTYRQHVLDTLALPMPYIVIGGRTGSGKTDLLHELQRRGEQIIDLEGLAHHKGSAFGALGLPPQPSTEHFENLIYTTLSLLDPSRSIWLEDESKNVGACHISHGMWQHMSVAPLVVLDIPLEVRIERLCRDYAEQATEGLANAIKAISKRLGNEATTLALLKLEEGNHAAVARITLQYYDRAYDYGLAIKSPRTRIPVVSDGTDMVSLTTIVLKTSPEPIWSAVKK